MPSGFGTSLSAMHVGVAVILLPTHPASFAHNFVSGMQSFYFSESQDATVLQTCHEKKCSGLISLQLGLIDMENSESQDS